MALYWKSAYTKEFFIKVLIITCGKKKIETIEASITEIEQPSQKEIPAEFSSDGQPVLTVEEENTYQVKRLYQVNNPKECMEETRYWKLQKDTEWLVIWDCLENQSIFEGIVLLDKEGNLINEKYYNMLLWNDLSQLWDYTEETSILTWIDEDKTKDHARKYNTQEELLQEAGFENSAPIYQYYDKYHNLKLELYMDKPKERFCGFINNYYFNSDKKKCVDRYGFTIEGMEDCYWEDNAFSMKSVYGTDGADMVDSYKEMVEYTQAGMVDSYISQGLMEHYEDGVLKMLPSNVLELHYVYRDDGTLYYRDYTHNPMIFGTTFCSLESYYDKSGRVVYESGYITHGRLEYYYIYKDEGDKPEYLLEIDYNGGYVIPHIKCYY